MAKSSNSHGNDARGVRRFLRSIGMKPNAANTERMGKELRRTESQNETHEKIAKEIERERGVSGLHDEKGDVIARRRAQVQRSLDARKRKEGRE